MFRPTPNICFVLLNCRHFLYPVAPFLPLQSELCITNVLKLEVRFQNNVLQGKCFWKSLLSPVLGLRFLLKVMNEWSPSIFLSLKGVKGVKGVNWVKGVKGHWRSFQWFLFSGMSCKIHHGTLYSFIWVTKKNISLFYYLEK